MYDKRHPKRLDIKMLWFRVPINYIMQIEKWPKKLIKSKFKNLQIDKNIQIWEMVYLILPLFHSGKPCFYWTDSFLGLELWNKEEFRKVHNNVIERRFFHVSEVWTFFFNFCIYIMIEKLTGATLSGYNSKRDIFLIRVVKV